MLVDAEPLFSNEPEKESKTNLMDQGKFPEVKSHLKCKYCNEEFLKSRGWRIRWKNHNEFCLSKTESRKTEFFAEDEENTETSEPSKKAQGIKCQFKDCDFYYKDNSSQPRNHYRRHLMKEHFDQKFEKEYGKIWKSDQIVCPDCGYAPTSKRENDGPQLRHNLKFHYWYKHVLQKYMAEEKLEMKNIENSKISTKMISVKNKIPMKRLVRHKKKKSRNRRKLNT